MAQKITMYYIEPILEDEDKDLTPHRYGPFTSEEAARREAEAIRADNPHFWGREGYRITAVAGQRIGSG